MEKYTCIVCRKEHEINRLFCSDKCYREYCKLSTEKQYQLQGINYE